MVSLTKIMFIIGFNRESQDFINGNDHLSNSFARDTKYEKRSCHNNYIMGMLLMNAVGLAFCEPQTKSIRTSYNVGSVYILEN